MARNRTAYWAFAALSATAVLALAANLLGDRPVAGRDRTRKTKGLSAESGAAAGSFDLKPRTPTEQKILTALDSETKVDFSAGVSLKDALSNLAEKHGITIVPDPKALNDAQIKLDELQTHVKLARVKLRSVLNLMLREHDLDYIIRDEVLQITTVEASNESLETHVYDTTRLRMDPTLLVDILKAETNSDPPGWKEDGAPNGGSITATSGALVVHQAQRVHAEISNLLQQLARLRPGALKSPPASPNSNPAFGGPRGGGSGPGAGGLPPGVGGIGGGLGNP